LGDLRTGNFIKNGLEQLALDFCIHFTRSIDTDEPRVEGNVGKLSSGRRGPDRQQAFNLGIFYEDNASKKRWVLKIDDPKTLA